ncbi:ROK family protein [Halosquirtibacter xylanolyticus]|uniref:ROK family protein n=1 Tax=Halosquirtibacter xylanolyticus TaxID=3374599 RepID=UPI003749EE1C|nr:ROK family protein [Prolixibacteraceae bacterium]
MSVNYAIGVDLGGTFIKFALVDQEGNKITDGITATQTEKGCEVVINNIIASIDEMLRFDPNITSSVIGIGIGTPGIVENGVVIGGAENLPNWFDLSLAEKLEKRFSLPVFIDNDANLMGLGEVGFGAAKSSSDIVFLTVGTGIGGAMYLNGQLYSGYRNRGGELGHMIIKSDGVDCECGAKGCLEAYASTTALVKDYVSHCDHGDKGAVDGKYIIAKYKSNDSLAQDVMNRHWDYLGDGIVGIINLFAPQKVVIGGGISEAGEFYFEALRQKVANKVMSETSQFTEIVPAELGNAAGIFGAVSLVFNSNKN